MYIKFTKHQVKWISTFFQKQIFAKKWSQASTRWNGICEIENGIGIKSETDKMKRHKFFWLGGFIISLFTLPTVTSQHFENRRNGTFLSPLEEHYFWWATVRIQIHARKYGIILNTGILMSSNAIINFWNGSHAISL